MLSGTPKFQKDPEKKHANPSQYSPSYIKYNEVLISMLWKLQSSLP